jgi:hypothetical protein
MGGIVHHPGFGFVREVVPAGVAEALSLGQRMGHRHAPSEDATKPPGFEGVAHYFPQIARHPWGGRFSQLEGEEGRSW